MALRSAVLLLAFVLAVLPVSAAPTPNNDDSCDIAVLPAATLLLPYFEVDVTSPNGATTLFTITNTSPLEQIARVKLWTDYAFEVVEFNIYLTGYDVQSINLYDVIVRGVIAPENGTGTEISPVGDFSVSNPKLRTTSCARLPGVIPSAYRTRMINAFTTGQVPALGALPECKAIGGKHTNAVGYATVDVVRQCASNLGPEDYYGDVILFDNVLTGDYQHIDRERRFSEGSPMVHIRAVPEGGTAPERLAAPEEYAVTFPRTFYSRFQPDGRKTFDARQPLPSLFAARWIHGSTSGQFRTTFTIWREGRTPLNAPCADYVKNVAGVVETVTFDEEENGQAAAVDIVICTPLVIENLIPNTARLSVADPVFPRPTTGAIAGWVYFNLDNCTRDEYASQNWVTTAMRAEGQFSVEMDATMLGNGCTPPLGDSEISAGTATIGPP